MQIPINILNKEKNMLGIIHIPEMAHNTIIVMCYGMNGNRVENHRISKKMAEQAEKMGMAFLRFDYFGLGISDGEFSDTSIEDKIEDAISAINFIMCCYKKKMRIFLIGYSDGAKVAYGVSKRLEEKMAVCYWNPVFNECLFSSNDTTNIPNNECLGLIRDTNSRKLVYPIPYTGLCMNIKYLSEVKENNFDIKTYISQTKNNLFFIFGDSDSKTINLKEQICDLKKEKEDTILIIPKADHLFSSIDFIELVINQTIKWAANYTYEEG